MQKQLEKARAHYAALELLPAYHIFRRYFDRMPFSVEEGHAEHIGMFVRVLLELGKTFELEFYLKAIEKAYSRRKDPPIGYALAIVYKNSEPRQLEAARTILEQILIDPKAVKFHDRAKLVLAGYYEEKEQIDVARSLINSIKPHLDQNLNRLVQLFRGLLLSYDRKYDEGLTIIRDVIRQTDPTRDWYVYFTGRINEGWLLFHSGRVDGAREVLVELDAFSEKHTLKSLQIQARQLRQLVYHENGEPVLRYFHGRKHYTLVLENRTVSFSNSLPWEKLLSLLLKKRRASKRQIINTLFKREYCPASDDSVIYYQMHQLRSRLKALGISPKTLILDKGEYRLNAKIEKERAEL